MTYWKRPKFWFALLIAEVAAFVASVFFAMFMDLALRYSGVPIDVAFELTNPTWLVVFGLLAYAMFLWTRWDYRERTTTQGFPVVTEMNED